MFDKLIKLTNLNLSTASSQEKILEIMPFSLTLHFEIWRFCKVEKLHRIGFLIFEYCLVSVLHMA